MAYFSGNFLKNRRKMWLRSIHAVEVQIDGKWHRGEINQKETQGDTLHIKATFPQFDSVACTITASRLIDIRGEEAAYQQLKIQKVAGQGTMLNITIPIYEVTQ